MNTRSPGLPAVLGGPPAVTLDHAAMLRWPQLTEEDANAVFQVMCDGDISRHRVVRQLEKAYAGAIGRKHALAHCNGAAAFLAAYLALGLRPGDQVLVPATAAATTVLPMLWLGAVPVFCDIEEKRLGIDPEEVERRVTPKTRALVLSHTWGMPCKLKGLLSLSRKHNLKVVEDASHALGAFWRERPCGSFGDIAIFRLQGDHLAPAGEGAILLCDETAYFEGALTLGDPGRLAELPTAGRHLAATGLGLNTRISPLCAAIGLNQLRQLDERNAMRNDNLNHLSGSLEELGLNTFTPPRHIQRVYTQFIVRYDTAPYGLAIDHLITALVREGCEARPAGFAPLYRQPLFTEGRYKEILRLPIHAELPDYKTVSLPVTEGARRSLIQLPAFPGPDDGLLGQYCRAFQKVFGCAGEIAETLGGKRDPIAAPARLRVIG